MPQLMFVRGVFVLARLPLGSSRPCPRRPAPCLFVLPASPLHARAPAAPSLRKLLCCSLSILPDQVPALTEESLRVLKGDGGEDAFKDKYGSHFILGARARLWDWHGFGKQLIYLAIGFAGGSCVPVG